MKHIRFFMAFVALLTGVSLVAPVATAAAANSPSTVVCGTLGAGSDCKTQPSGGVDLNKTLSAVINILSMVVGIIAVIMIIISGLKFITANGDAGAVKSARHTLTYALVGVVVVAMAQVLVRFVLGHVVK